MILGEEFLVQLKIAPQSWPQRQSTEIFAGPQEVGGVGVLTWVPLFWLWVAWDTYRPFTFSKYKSNQVRDGDRSNPGPKLAHLWYFKVTPMTEPQLESDRIFQQDNWVGHNRTLWHLPTCTSAFPLNGLNSWMDSFSSCKSWLNEKMPPDSQVAKHHTAWNSTGRHTAVHLRGTPGVKCHIWSNVYKHAIVFGKVYIFLLPIKI